MISLYLIKRFNISSTSDRVQAIIAGTCLSAPVIVPCILVYAGILHF